MATSVLQYHATSLTKRTRVLLCVQVRVLTAITGSCLSHGRLIPYLSEYGL